MKFVSTRGIAKSESFSEAVRIGLASDGGLFVPERWPDLRGEFEHWEGLSYPMICYEFLKRFATDIEPEELKKIALRSYRHFDHEEWAPLKQLADNLYVQELFHGPTLAFKDFALQLLGNLYERQVERTGRPINVLGATSGDTGAAAISGLLGKQGVNVFILYPDGRVSPLQERQMTCTGADNVYPLAIEGSFDDAQAALKDVFSDKTFCEALGVSAVNSINIARVLAQCVYYIYAWLRLPASARKRTTFVVPTGNFGNVLAGWMASQMGMEVAGFRVATNQNDILHRFFSSGSYAVGEVRPSHAPSMDIQVASNFERFLYFALDRDGARTRAVMEGFKRDKAFVVESGSTLIGSMGSTRMDDEEISKTIADVYRRFGYVTDPHTACCFKELESLDVVVALATAHPAKFPEVVSDAIGRQPTHPSLEALKKLQPVKYSVLPDAYSIKQFIRSQYT